MSRIRALIKLLSRRLKNLISYPLLKMKMNLEIQIFLLFADEALPEHGWSEHDQQEPSPRGVHSEESGLADEGRGKGAATPNTGRRRGCQPESLDLIVVII